MTADTLTQLWMIVISKTRRDRSQVPEPSFHTEISETSLYIHILHTAAVIAALSVAFLNSTSQALFLH